MQGIAADLSVFAASGRSSFCSSKGVGVQSGGPLALRALQSGGPPRQGAVVLRGLRIMNGSLFSDEKSEKNVQEGAKERNRAPLGAQRLKHFSRSPSWIELLQVKTEHFKALLVPRPYFLCGILNQEPKNAKFKRTFARTIRNNVRAPHMQMWGCEAKRARKFTRTLPRTLPWNHIAILS